MARRKISEQAEAIEDLPALTDKQYAFVKGLLDGKSASDAYRHAYDAENMADQTVWVRASELRNHSKIAVWLMAAKQAHFGDAKLSLDKHMLELERLKEMALASGNHGAAIQAEQLRGKACGFYKEQLEVTHHDPIAILEQIAAIDADMARKLAEEDGIEWEPAGTKH